MSLTRINEFTAAEDKADELFAFLKELSHYISTSAGCASCEVLRSDNDRKAFVVIEKWDSAESHQASLDNYPKEKMAEAMPLFGAPPKGGFYHA